MRPLGKKDCVREFSSAFSQNLIPAFQTVFEFFKEHAIDQNSLIRKLHLGYTAMRPEAFDFVCFNFPWIRIFQNEMGLTNKINFLETHPKLKPSFQPHIDGKNGNPHVMLNCPIQRCNQYSTTSWVLASEKFDPILQAENGDTQETSRGATPHIPSGIKYNIIANHCFTDKISLFRSDIYHMVHNKDDSDESRIMMHWWFPPEVTWENAVARFSDLLEVE
jgi:hypothetical protein